jgi:hypothetical protein
MKYIYNNKLLSPNLDQIHIDISNSEMIDKSIEWCRWDEDTTILQVKYTNVLSSEDKIILDQIVENDS